VYFFQLLKIHQRGDKEACVEEIKALCVEQEESQSDSISEATSEEKEEEVG